VYRLIDLPNLLRQAWSSRRDGAGALLYWSGAGRVFELAARPRGAIILMYHSVARDDTAEFVDPPNRMAVGLFERQMAFLRAKRRVVPLSDLVEDIASGQSPVAGTVCITFDDGYVDNLTVAAPILAKYDLPATIYLATGYVERGETQWADTLHCLFQYRTCDALHLPGLASPAVDLSRTTEQRVARRTIRRVLLEAGVRERHDLLEEIERQLRPKRKPPRLTMTWQEARELLRRNPRIEIGGHTRDHIDLRRCDAETALRQITGCRDDVHRELGIEAAHFSCPSERWSTQVRDMVIASGWRSAVGAGAAYRIAADSDRFAMPRVESPLTMTEIAFKTSGAYPAMLSMLGLAPQ
jgi:peptidoglycan/xylan/chitin deacetylase (PgdA/CDA1 family)